MKRPLASTTSASGRRSWEGACPAPADRTVELVLFLPRLLGSRGRAWIGHAASLREVAPSLRLPCRFASGPAGGRPVLTRPPPAGPRAHPRPGVAPGPAPT